MDRAGASASCGSKVGAAPARPLIGTSLSGGSMHITQVLLNNSAQDLAVLEHNRSIGDRAEIARDIDFAFHTKDEGQANTVGAFINDNHYGSATYEAVDDPKFGKFWRVVCVVHAPATEQVVCSISGVMACIGVVFNIEYVGWGSLVQK
jgi:hypothetical protein